MNMKNISGIKSVSSYVASPVECCDRCSQGIKQVYVVIYKDGLREKFGCECINRILAGDNSLKSLFKRNAAKLKKYQRYLEILSLPEADIPIREEGYFGRGFNMIADDSGRALCFDHYFFHPTKLGEQVGFSGRQEHVCFGVRPGGSCWMMDTQENWTDRCRYEIEKGRAKLQAEIARIEKFLARVVAKGMAQEGGK
jgi:hypothetical protein